MFQGFYNLTSGMLTQTRNLNVISNNMANVSTPGYKRDQFVAKTFQEELIYRSGNNVKNIRTPLGQMNRIVTADRNYVDYTEAGFRQSTSPLDFALSGKGFFQVNTAQGMVYTRNGSFSLDGAGYLCLQGVGRVQGSNGPIYLGTDKIQVDQKGNIYNESGANMGTLKVVAFENEDEMLTKSGNGVFTASGEGTVATATVVQNALEYSNVEAVVEMSEMMSAQRSLQSNAQVMRMYDQLIGKIVNNLGVN
ncbi:flagellar basal-body rod protein FlgF [Lachnospiraceae bacterium PF1-21]|uniref:Flagellar hook basal-body protein n=1 Tax=Ohessyouella blattaphilus TaxID=2949333 RepID=A0ABT1EER8_9FIRM|nr:flagellar hook basal-body protein [Ohessyouella blattaphilus]MCP1109138.1 flagellar hook basal-body protein [Ohessyouella blattaphilus]MCR8562532.1 flagellar hook basal-body protein [Ohessyouella blattaphilus]MDL2250240.1 flagellar hook basal-body protein [Lachnospiraceae bacterium OttesenSCG-928-J05]